MSRCSAPLTGGLLGLVLSSPISAQAASGTPIAAATCVWKTSDIIDKRIDVSAQKSLMRQMSKGPPKSTHASAMLSAIKSGRLAGIYLPPRKAVSDRGKLLSPPKGYWQLIPSGKHSVCLRQPSNLPPMIVYRENLSAAQIDAALVSAWKTCGLPTPVPGCGYNVNLHPPECTTDSQCIAAGTGNRCIDYHCVHKKSLGGPDPDPTWRRVRKQGSVLRATRTGNAPHSARILCAVVVT